ncbi:uncharacterized protein LOC135397506 [Ornithodoros turicata]|uniref:uncharacterized protein LOC135397506 n=1 Tax=Ornithodoros turicata TaxID=34597 RepID=UPI00313A3D86
MLTPLSQKYGVWSTLRAIEGLPRPSNPLVTLSVSSKREPKDLAEEFARELAQVASCIDHRPSLRDSASDGSPTDDDITMTELHEAVVKGLKRRSAVGPDGISNQALKNLSDEQLVSLLQLFNKVWCSGSIPPDWKHARVIPILKKGRPPD